jgi:small conductance mechanosensitive channel
MKPISFYVERLIELTVEYAPKVLLAIIVLIIGWWLAHRVAKLISRQMSKAGSDHPEITQFLISVTDIGLKILVIISVAGIVGIETTSFVGIIAAMGFAIGLALQGNLSNFAAGVIILIMRPFKVGDEVKIDGHWTYVKEIQIFHTILENFDHTEVIIPNSVITSGTIQNMSSTPIRDITIVLLIPFEESLDRVLEVVNDAVYSVPEIIKDAKPFFWILDNDSHAMKVSIGYSTSQEGYWDTDFKLRKTVINAFAEHNIKVSYPVGVAFGEYGKWARGPV